MEINPFYMFKKKILIKILIKYLYKQEIINKIWILVFNKLK